MKVNLISRDNGVGLSRDVKLVTDLLKEDGHEVTFCEYGLKPDLSKPLADVNIFVELVWAAYFNRAKVNVSLPNPEWYDMRWRQFLPKFNAILCKTKSAVTAFQILSRKCKYTSFTSPDRFSPLYQKNEDRWLHVAGKSGQKGTDVVYQTWAENPDFPHLTIIQNPGKAKERKPLPNMTLLYDHVSEEQLIELQNSCGVHLCPSEAEGFGHYIVEAMSARALVVTTDGPPMNELITQDRGVLCKWETKARQRFGTNYYVTPKTLADAAKAVIGMGEAERNERREKARQFYEENDTLFRKAFKEAIRELGNAKHSANTVLASRRLPVRYA